MVSWSGHVVPFIVTVAVWFVATGLVAWADNRERATFSRSLAIGGAGGILGLIVILVASQSVSVPGVYVAFIGALMVWGWHEIGFLTGASAGPRRGSRSRRACAGSSGSGRRARRSCTTRSRSR